MSILDSKTVELLEVLRSVMTDHITLKLLSCRRFVDLVIGLRIDQLGNWSEICTDGGRAVAHLNYVGLIINKDKYMMNDRIKRRQQIDGVCLAQHFTSLLGLLSFFLLIQFYSNYYFFMQYSSAFPAEKFSIKHKISSLRAHPNQCSSL